MSLRNLAEPVTLVRSPTLTNKLLRSMVSGSRPLRRQAGSMAGSVARRQACDGAHHGADVLGRGAAAAAHHVEESAGRELAEDGGGLLRGLVVFAEGIRQPGVRIGAHIGVGNARELLDVGAQLLSAERAIESDDGGPRVPDGIPERLRGLARQGAAGGVADGARDDDGQFDAGFIQTPRTANSAALAFKVSNMVSIRMTSTPPSISARVAIE